MSFLSWRLSHHMPAMPCRDIVPLRHPYHSVDPQMLRCKSHKTEHRENFDSCARLCGRQEERERVGIDMESSRKQSHCIKAVQSSPVQLLPIINKRPPTPPSPPLLIPSSSRKLQIPNRAPIRTPRLDRQTRQMLAPRTPSPPLVEIPQQQDKPNQSAQQSRASQQPPSPPNPATVLEKRKRLLDKTANTSVGVVFRTAGEIGRSAARDGRWGAQDADSEDETHEEATDVGEVV
jgi:hypothetical protein